MAKAKKITKESNEVEDKKEEIIKLEEELEYFFNFIPDMLSISSADGYFKKVNKEWERVLGYTEKELLAKPFINFIHPDDVQPTLDIIAKQAVKSNVLNFINRYRAKDGSYKWFEWTSAPAKQNGTIYAVARDITSRKLIEIEIVQKNRMLRILSNINQLLIHAKDESSLLTEACRIINEIAEYRMLWIGFKENDKKKSIKPVAVIGFESGFIESIHPTWEDDENGHIPAGIAIRTGKMFISQDISLESFPGHWKNIALEHGYNSVISFPLKNGDQTFGSLTIFGDKKNHFSEDEIKILDELANDLAFGIISLRTISERKALETELLKASADRYKALFLSSRDAIMTLEPPSWKFTSGNPATIKMFQAKNEGDFLNHEPWILSPEFQLDGSRSDEKAKAMINHAMEKGTNLFEWTHKRLNGEEFPAEVLLSKVQQNGNSYLHAVVRDITERKKMEEKLKEYAEEKFKAIFDNTLDGILIADVKTKSLYLANPALCKMVGYSLEEIQKMNIANIHPKENLPYVMDKFEKQVREEIKMAENIQVKKKDGGLIYCDISASPITLYGKKYLLGIFRDISERKKMEDNLLKSEKHYKEAQRIGRVGSWEWNIATDTIIWSEEYYELVGFDPKKSPPNYAEHLKVYTLESQARLDAAVKHQTKTGQPYEVDLEFVNPKSPTRWITARSETVYDDKGKIIGLRGTAQDISLRKKEEEDLRKTKEKLQQEIIELERFQSLAVHRELKMVELKNKIKELEEKLFVK